MLQTTRSWLVGVGLALALVVAGVQAGPRAVFPGTSWERAPTPEAAGFSSSRLAGVGEMAKRLGPTALVVVSGGRIVLEHGDLAEVTSVASVRKSVLAMLFGKYVANGTIRLEETLSELKITDHGGLSASELQATVGDLMAARSGIYHPASNGGDNLAEAPPRGSKAHGSYFLYNNWDFNALGTIFEQETGRNIYDAFEADLARPIGMEDFHRERQEKSGDLAQSMHPAYHVFLSTRDMARLGYLMLRDGRWEQRQVVPRAWVKRIVTPVTRNFDMNPAAYRDGAFGYGLLWWVMDGESATGPYAGAYTAIGIGGQFITVLPAIDVVVAQKVKPSPEGHGVSTSEYFSMIDALVAARTASAPLASRTSPVGAQASRAATGPAAGLASRVDPLVTRRLASSSALAISAVAGGKIVFERSYGQARLDGVYEYGSVSKPVTSTIILQLRRDGWINSLDDDVRMYLPRYANAMPRAYAGARLTLKHLLTHRGGIPHNDKPLFAGDTFNLQFEPGTKWLYSTPGYALLGEVIQAVTGLSYSDAVRKYIGQPVGAVTMRADDAYIAPGAFVRSTVKDMARFAIGIMDNRYFPANVLYEEALHPQEGSYGYGWQVTGVGTDDITAEHGGSNGLPRAYLLIKPRQRAAVAILAEAQPGGLLDLDALAAEVLSKVREP